jgi:hypothetical protein
VKKFRLRGVPTPAVPDRATRMTILEEICRQKISEIIQAALVAEADEFLGRIAGVPGRSISGYRDGYEEPRTIAYGNTPVTIRRPRVRESETPFSSEILPPYVRRFPELDKAMHELWLQGLSTRDFEPSLRALVGQKHYFHPRRPRGSTSSFSTTTIPGVGAQGRELLARRRRAHDRVLRLPQRTLKASAHDERDRVEL